MLSIMAQAYQDIALSGLPLAETVEAQRRQVLQRYFEQTLARRGGENRYTLQQTQRWLSWLASQMKQRSQTVFFLEQMQPDWLMSKRAEWHYILLDRLSGALLVGLIVAFGFGCAIVGYGMLRGMPDSYLHGFGHNMLVVGLLGAVVGGLFGGFDERAAYRPANRLRWAGGIVLDWISGGLFLGLIARLVVGAPGSAMIFALVGCAIGALAKRPTIRPRHINIVETLRWSWARTRRLMPTCITGGAIVGLLTGIFVGMLDGLLGKVFSALAGSLIAGSLIGLLMSLVFGITHTELNELTVFPNQGIWRSARNAAWAGVEGALIGGTLGALVASGPISWLLVAFLGAIISALAFGYYAFLSHFALRFVLWRNGVVPWRYTQFLDYPVDRILLRKVGGGYMFIHGLLQDHLATLESNTSGNRLGASNPPQSSLSFQAAMST